MKGYRLFSRVFPLVLSLTILALPKQSLAADQRTCLEWNSFLGPVFNIYETGNSTASTANAAATLYDLSGAQKGSVNYTVAAGGQTDIILSSLDGYKSDSYGLVCAASQANLSGRVLVYKVVPGTEANPQFQFAYAIEDAALRGNQFVSFNTIQPSLAAGDANNLVANWIQVSNPSVGESGSYSGSLKVYDFDGDLVTSTRLTVPAGGRVDFGVHDIAPHTVGLVEWQPDNQDALFQVRNVRYLYDNASFAPSFETAFQLSGSVPQSETVVAPFDTRGTADGAQDAVVELSNTSNVYRGASITFYDANGGPLTVPISVSMPAHGSFHYVIDTSLNNLRGFVKVDGKDISAVVMQYGRRTDAAYAGGIYSMYGVPAREATSGSLYGSYNTYLSQDSEIWVVNAGEADKSHVSVTRSDGTVLANESELALPARGLGIYSVNSVESANYYGRVRVDGDATAAWVFRRRGSDYVIPLPLSASDASSNENSSSTSRTTTTGTSAIVSPLSGATIKGTIAFQANASVTPGSVNKVKFDIDGSQISSSAYDNSAPYQWTLDTTKYKDGSHKLRIRVYGSNGFEVLSLRREISVTISNAVSGPVCGNNSCEAGETTSSCPVDCKPATVCGNGICESGETTALCAADCPAPVVCGDGTCSAGESCTADCGSPVQCGDGLCNGTETLASCPLDCGSSSFTKTMHMYRKGSPFMGSSGTDAEKAQYASFYTSLYQMMEPGYGTGSSKLAALKAASSSLPLLNYQKISGIKSQSGAGCCTSGNCAQAGDVDDQIFADAVKYNLFFLKHGNRVINPDNGWCYADLTGTASSDDASARGGKTKLAKWIDVLVARVPGKANATNISGIFLDNALIPFDGYAAESTGTAVSFYADSTLMTNWYSGMRQVVAALRQAFPTKIIVANAYSSSNSVADNQRGFEIIDAGADAIMGEESIFKGSGTYYDFTRFSRIVKDFNDMAHGRRLTNGAKQVIQFDDSVSITDTTNRYYALATYLLIQGENVMYSPFYGDSDVTNLPEFHLDLGAPSGEYTINSTTGLMTRTFQKGTVVLNPNKSGAAISVNTSGKHKLTISGGGTWSPTNSNSGTLSWSTALPSTYSLQPNEALIFN